MNESQKKFAGAIMAVLIALAGVGMVNAAPGSIDTTPPADTNTTVYIQDGKTIQTGFEANGSIDYALPVLNATGASADDLAMNVSVDGVEYYTFSGTWNSYDSGEPDTSTDYIHNVSGDSLSRVPMAINQNVTMNVTYWNESAATPTPTTVQVYVENGDTRSVQRATADAAFVDIEETKAPLYRPFSDDYNSTKLDDTVDVNGSNTSVIYTLEGSTVQDPFANHTEEVTDTGSFTLMRASVDGDDPETVPVFYNGVPDWYDMSEDGSYAVYDSDANTLTYELSRENFDGELTADVMASSDVYRVTDLWTAYQLAGGRTGSGTEAITQMVM